MLGNELHKLAFVLGPSALSTIYVLYGIHTHNGGGKRKRPRRTQEEAEEEEEVAKF